MNQFEFDTLRFSIGLFAVLCVSFYFRRFRIWLWGSLPRIVMLCSLGWFVSALVVVGGTLMVFLPGLLLGLAYLVVVLTSPPLLAAGMFEVMLGLYALFKTADSGTSLPARPHFVAGLSSFACLGAYCIVRAIPR
jgi:hypothetical protein